MTGKRWVIEKWLDIEGVNLDRKRSFFCREAFGGTGQDACSPALGRVAKTVATIEARDGHGRPQPEGVGDVRAQQDRSVITEVVSRHTQKIAMEAHSENE